MDKKLGKISKAVYGFGGYQDAQFGYWISFSMPGGGVGTGDGFWTGAPAKSAKWTSQDQVECFGKITKDIIKIMQQAKVRNFTDLVGIPVELTFDSLKLISWRILEEVL